MNRPFQLTLMAVHAHPDDEASSTGGILARYSTEGVQTVVVTCTNGELGDAPGGIKPGEEGFSEELVVATRRRELDESCRLLGVRHLHRLGYHDSGMMGWPSNEDPLSFWRQPVEHAAAPLIELVKRYRPQVLVTYDEHGFYGHPDHIQAHRITMHAAEATGIPDKIYFPAIPRSRVARFGEVLVEAGIEPPPEVSDDAAPDAGEPPFGTPDELVTSHVDCAGVVRRKHAALAAHASQTDSTFFLRLPDASFDELFAVESFVRFHDRLGAPTPESDLFAGLR